MAAFFSQKSRGQRHSVYKCTFKKLIHKCGSERIINRVLLLFVNREVHPKTHLTKARMKACPLPTTARLLPPYLSLLLSRSAAFRESTSIFSLLSDLANVQLGPSACILIISHTLYSEQSKTSDKNRHKKPKDVKPKVKKLKYHQYIPPDQKAEKSPPPMDSAYARLLQQQQLFLQLQILSQQKHAHTHPQSQQVQQHSHTSQLQAQAQQRQPAFSYQPHPQTQTPK